MAIKDTIFSYLKRAKKQILTENSSNLLIINTLTKYLLLLLLLITISTFFAIGYKNTIIKTKQKQEQGIREIEPKKSFSLKKILKKKLKSPYEEISYIIQGNDTFDNILKKFEIDKKDSDLIIQKIKSKKLQNILIGNKLNMFIKNENNTKRLINISYQISNTKKVELKRFEDEFILNEITLKLLKKEVVRNGEIKSSLYQAALDVGIEPNIIIEFARIYGFEIDFQRDVRKGDNFEIYYEKYLNKNKKVVSTGKIIYASMKVNNRDITLYNFEHEKFSGYYDISGKSIEKTLMKTPINGARLSSSYGMRKHPILGFNKLHTGTDFAAKSGTPIMASGSGTIVKAGWCGGGGNCIKIRHNTTYQTVYAHMKNFARGMKKGKKVKQGQIIGYVGSTGMSTGPHLHYEVIVNNKKVNSQKLKLPSNKVLSQEARKIFEIDRIKIDLSLNELRVRK